MDEQTLTAESRIAALPGIAEATDTRLASLRTAIELGADDATLLVLWGAKRLSKNASTIILPAHRLENMSRGKGWCRRGSSAAAIWGERVEGGYKVGPGRWTVGGNDGYSRKGETVWDVSHAKVGVQIWTAAK